MSGWMITTEDNPYDPRLDFKAWYMWDTGHGYNSSAYLARIAAVSEEFPEAIQDAQIEMAIDEIIEMHSGKMYIKLSIDDPVPSPTSSAA